MSFTRGKTTVVLNRKEEGCRVQGLRAEGLGFKALALRGLSALQPERLRRNRSLCLTVSDCLIQPNHNSLVTVLPGCAQKPPNIKMEPPKSKFNIRGGGGPFNNRGKGLKLQPT